jgi:AcrR family transcriptional regulator
MPARVSLREQQKQFTRSRLVEAALEVFLEKGYSAATIDDIVSAAGASRATFYLHFDAKVQLVTELIQPARVDAQRLFEELGGMSEPSREGMEEWLARIVGYWETHRNKLDVTTQAIVVEPELAADYYATTDRLVDALTQLIRRQAGDVDEESRLRAAMLCIGLERFCYFWIVRRLEFDRNLVLRTLADMWWELLAHKPDAQLAPAPASNTRSGSGAR